MKSEQSKEITSQRTSLLRKIETHLEVPMLILSFVWLLLMILEFTTGLSPFFLSVNNFIWFLFVLDFLIRFAIAPSKKTFLTKRWITAFALALPALRLFRIFQVIRLLRLTSAARALRLARVLTSLNRGITALGKSFRRRGVGYILGLTTLVLFAGAAGILSFEKEHGILADYGTAVWWTAIMLTTMGSDYFPKSSEGRFLCLLLALYGFAIFGYLTAAIATFFVGRDAEDKNSEIAGQRSVDELSREVKRLNEKLDLLVQKLESSD